VTGGTPTEPVVKYLDLSDSLEDGRKQHKLAPSSFAKLGADWALGSTVAYKDGAGHKWGVLLNATADKLLVLEGSYTLRVVPRADAAPIPTKPELKAGAKVFAPFMSDLGPASVVKVDRAAGRITVKLDFASSAEATVPYGQVALTLP
jgi:hypothetical protein